LFLQFSYDSSKVSDSSGVSGITVTFGCEVTDTLTFDVRIKKTAEYKTKNARFDRSIPDDKDVNKLAVSGSGVGETVSLAHINAKRVPEMARAYTPWNRLYTLIHSCTLTTFPHAKLSSAQRSSGANCAV
ncbi:hypothetical protein TSAR_004080, partial [Trichomalopsis sarcophagae]